MTKSVSNASPVFVVGMNGSGTTMLLDCLDNHSMLYGFKRETRVLPYFMSSLAKYGDLSQDNNFLRLWNDIRNIPDFKDVNNGVSPPLPEDWQSFSRDLAFVIDYNFHYFAEKEGKSRWCEKTPMHALHIVSLAELFPGAKFIHIIRDGRACAASFHRRWGHTPELTIYRWKNVVHEARRQGAIIKARYFEIYYEDLVRDPETWMRKVCDFLDIPYDRNVLSLSRSRTITGSTDKSIVEKEDKWRTHFNEQEITRLENIAGKTLSELGYIINSTASDKDPSLIHRKLWLFRDYIRLGLMFAYKDLTGNNRGKWKKLFWRITRAVKQRITTKY